MYELVVTVLSTLNTRELAVSYWTLAIFAIMLINSKLRQSIITIIQAALASRLIVYYSIVFVYVVLMTLLLQALSIWTINQSKITFLWTISIGLFGINQAIKLSESPADTRKILWGSLNLTILLEFFVNFYIFPLAVEMIFVPVNILLGLLIGFSSIEEKYLPAKRLLEWFLVAFGTGITIYAIWLTWMNPKSFFNLSTYRDLAIPIGYSILYTPFIVVFSIFIAYERVYACLRNTLKDHNLLRWIKLQSLLNFRSDTYALEAWSRHVSINQISSKKELKDSMKKYLKRINEQINDTGIGEIPKHKGDHARYFLLSAEPQGEFIETVHKRVSLESVGFSASLIDCKNFQYKDLGYWEDEENPPSYNLQSNWIVAIEESSKWHLIRFVCSSRISSN